MSDNQLWVNLNKFADEIRAEFDNDLVRYEDPRYEEVIKNPGFEGWTDTFWTGPNIRKAHLKTVEIDKQWLLHINIFPEDGCNYPILGFDIVASHRKATGSFFDLSSVSDYEHPVQLIYHEQVKDLKWRRPRKLPEWAQQIFSDDMLAIGGLDTGPELDQLMEISMKIIKLYLMMSPAQNIKTDVSTKTGLNKYCHYQKQNPHLHRAITAMGISDKAKDMYIENILFEEI